MQIAVTPSKDKPLPFQIGDQKTEATIYFDSEVGQLVEAEKQRRR